MMAGLSPTGEVLASGLTHAWQWVSPAAAGPGQAGLAVPLPGTMGLAAKALPVKEKESNNTEMNTKEKELSFRISP